MDNSTATRNKYDTESEYRIPKLTEQLFHSLLTNQEHTWSAAVNLNRSPLLVDKEFGSDE
jgi:hypothetical protein